MIRSGLYYAVTLWPEGIAEKVRLTFFSTEYLIVLTLTNTHPGLFIYRLYFIEEAEVGKGLIMALQLMCKVINFIISFSC